MSLLWIANPDFYSTSHLARFWSAAHADAQVSSSGGLDGTAGFTGSTASAYLRQFVGPGDSDRVRIGARIRYTAYPSSAQIILAAIEEDAVIQACVSLNPDGTLTAWRGPMTSALVTSSALLTLNATHRLGFSATISRASGEVEVHLNSSRTVPNIVAAVSGVNTAESDHIAWHGVYLGLHPSGVLSHAYVVDGEGAVNSLVPGVRARITRPSAAGLFDEWDKTGGTLPQVLDDVTPDDDTTIIDTDTFGSRYSTAMDTVATARAILGAQSTACVRNIAGSGYSPSHEPLVVLDEAEHYAPWQSCPSATWLGIRRMWPVNPRTGLTWTLADVNAAEFGGRVRG